MGLLAHGLLPASFRGAPFAVESDDTGGGRRIALHVYPGRDEPWAEDLGRAPRVFRFRGFIVDGDVLFAGGPIQLQRLLLLAALEKAGAGTLTHPTLGVLNVVVRSFSLGADLGAGRMSRLDVEFVESGKRSFPSLLSSSSGLLSAANLAKVALAVDLVRAATLAAGALGRESDARAAGRALAGQAQAAAFDATGLMRLTALQPGSFGRYSAGANAGYLGTNPAPQASLAMGALIAQAAAARAAVSDAGAGLDGIIATTGTATSYGDVGAQLAAIVDALLAACADPADAVRLLLDLLGYQPAIPAALSAIGQGMILAFRRAIVAALARACGSYQPASYDDAFALLAAVAAAMDAEATAAADHGDDASFKAVRALRAETVRDLRARGATIARVRAVALPAPLPALSIAQRLYRDPSRAGELISEAAPRHPLFMPTSLTALAA